MPRLRSGLAIVQLALSMTLLVGALLLIATLRNLRAVDLGFDPVNVITLRVDLQSNGFGAGRAVRYARDLMTALDALPATRSAAIGQRAPFSFGSLIRVVPPSAPENRAIRAWTNGIDHKYSAVLRSELLRGRTFSEEEAFAMEPANAPVVINETLSTILFGGTDPIGRTVHVPRIGAAPARNLPIIGLVRDAHWANVDGSPEPFLYEPLARYSRGVDSATIIIRSQLQARDIAEQVRRVAADIDRRVPLSEPDTLSNAFDRQIREQRLFGGLLVWLTALAVTLAAIGLHGLVAQLTAERSREFGIRIAIGARRTDIARLVARHVGTMAGMGTAAGVGLSILGTAIVRSMLFRISALDPRVYAAAAIILIAVVAGAAAWPTLRATRVEPVEYFEANEQANGAERR